jgi:hypothetical protein
MTWQQEAAAWLEHKAELETNSLHCGDNSMTIASTHRYAAMLRALAKELRDANPQ